MEIVDLGLLRYAEALRLMETTHAELVSDPSKTGTIFIVEHPPVVTMGNRNLQQDMLLGEEFLRQRGVDFAKVDRGGSVTVHEPGQLVVYPVLRLNSRTMGAKAFVTKLEQVMIDLCRLYEIEACRDAINPGVWVGKNKIGAVGVRISNAVSKHGLAFNVTNLLSTFEFIVPCGIRGRGVTSLKIEDEKSARDEREISFEKVKKQMVSLLQTHFESSE